MKYEFLLNEDIDITNSVSIGTTIVERLAEELDYGKLNIAYSTREYPYEMFGYIQINIYDNDKLTKSHNMFIVDDEYYPISKEGTELKNLYYRHELSLMEVTHLLDYEIINTLTFTRPTFQENRAPFYHMYSYIYPEDKLSLNDEPLDKYVVGNDDLSNDYYSEFVRDYNWERVHRTTVQGQLEIPNTQVNVYIPNQPHIPNKTLDDKLKIEKQPNAEIRVNYKLNDEGVFYFGHEDGELPDKYKNGQHFEKEDPEGNEHSDYYTQLQKYKEVPQKVFVIDENKNIVYQNTLDKDIEIDLPEKGNYEIHVGLAPTKIPTSTFTYYDPSQVDYEKQAYSNFTYIQRMYQYHVTIRQFKPYTVYDFIKRIRNISPITTRDKLNVERLFFISDELKERTKNIYLPQLFLRKLTVREALNIGFKYINAVVRLEREQENNILSANFFNDRRDKFTFDVTDAYSFHEQIDTDEYMTSSRTFLQNTINSNDIENTSVHAYGKNTPMGSRSEDIMLTLDNPKLKLKYNIFRLKKITAKVPIRIQYWPSSEDLDTFGRYLHYEKRELIDVDLTSRIVEQSIYDTRLETNDVVGASFGRFSETLANTRGDFFRNYRIELGTYKYGDNVIDLSGTVGLFVKRTKLYRILEASVAEELQFRVGENIKVSDHFDEDKDVRVFFDYEQLVLAGPQTPLVKSLEEYKENDYMEPVVNFDFIKNIGFNIEYIALDDTVQDTEREYTSDIFKASTQRINQNEPMINYERAGVSSFGIVQRYGVPTIEYSKYGENPKSIEDIGDYNQNNEVIVEQESVYHQDYLLRNYEASRDFNRLAKYIGIDKEYRPYEMPGERESVQRNDIYKEYLEYYTTDEEPVVNHDNDVHIHDKFIENMLNTVVKDKDKEKAKLKVGLVKTDAFEELFPPDRYVDETDTNNAHLSQVKPFALLTPLKIQSSRQVFSFSFGWDSNTIAGNRILPKRVDQIDEPEDSDFWDDNVGFEEDESKIGDFIDATLPFSDDGKITPDDNVARLTRIIGRDYAMPYMFWKEFIRYTDENGFFKYLNFKLLDEYQPDFSKERDEVIYETTRDLPLVQSQDETYFSYLDENTYIGTQGDDFKKALVIDKDPSEVYKFTYQVNVVPKYNEVRNNIVIGKNFFNRNNVVYDNEEKTYLYFHNADDKSVNKYFYFHDKYVHPWEERKEITPDDLEITEYGLKLKYKPNIPNYFWSIGNENEELYIGVNNQNKHIVFEKQRRRNLIDYAWRDTTVRYNIPKISDYSMPYPEKAQRFYNLTIPNIKDHTMVYPKEANRFYNLEIPNVKDHTMVYPKEANRFYNLEIPNVKEYTLPYHKKAERLKNLTKPKVSEYTFPY